MDYEYGYILLQVHDKFSKLTDGVFEVLTCVFKIADLLEVIVDLDFFLICT